MTLAMRQWLAGAGVCVLLVAAFVSPRLVATVLGIFAFAILAFSMRQQSAAVRSEILPNPPGPGPIGMALAFSCFALISATWSASPSASLLKPLFLSLAVLMVWGLCTLLQQLSRRQVGLFGEAVSVSCIIGMVFVAVEVLTDQLLTRSVMSMFPALYASIAKHVTVVDGEVTAISETNLNRRIALAVWWLWPALLIAAFDRNRVRAAAVSVAMLAGAGVILVLGGHQSSQVAIAGGTLTYAAARFNVNWTRRGLAAIWLAASFLVVPLAAATFAADLHKAPWLFHSARHRVVIWGQTAELIAKAPLLGVGADATKAAMRKATSQVAPRDDLGEFKSGYGDHAHNVYLQVWYELGLIGALLFAAVGLAGLSATRALPAPAQPYGLALFASMSLMIATSYSLWQPWFLAAGAIALAALLVGAAMARTAASHNDADSHVSHAVSVK